jgi:hypothetical protein
MWNSIRFIMECYDATHQRQTITMRVKAGSRMAKVAVTA